MSKRKHDEDEDGEDGGDTVDVHFDYYNLAENDYHALHRLLIQLFGADADVVQTNALTDVLLATAQRSGVGSTIKTDEEEGSDPYAVLSVIPCRDNPGLGLVDYVLSKVAGDRGFVSVLQSPASHVGVVLSERLINMPVQVMAPMYRMLADEIEEAVEEGQAYDFSHYLIVSRVYRLTPEEEERHSKRHRPAGPSTDDGHSFHPEDKEIMRHASHVVTYSYTNPAENTGVEVGGRAMLVTAENFKALVKEIEKTYVN